MLFHAGALWRLNEVGWLNRIDRVSAVSGGSITAGMLALAWGSLDFDEHGCARGLIDQVVAPLRRLASHTIDVRAVIAGAFEHGSIADHAARSYREHLFGDATLSELPAHPIFIFNATSMQSGELFRFTRDYVADWRVGRVNDVGLPLANAVAASAAFPPFLSPEVIDLQARQWTQTGELTDPAYRQKAVLADGGVYDNLGLEAAWKRCKTVLVSDAGGHMADDPDPHKDWPELMARVLQVIDNQVRDLRKRECVTGYTTGDRKGAYWGIRADIANYGVEDVLGAPFEQTTALAHTPTRLGSLDEGRQQRLINWGYAICDAALRAHVPPPPDPPSGFPYPDARVGP
jgi:NTE family protein